MNRDWLIDGSDNARWTFAFAHGAGAPMDSEFMARIAQGVAARGIRVVRFEFDYMAERRRSGKKKAPDRGPKLQTQWREVIDVLGAESLIIGGKSMGGRIASLVADQAGVAGLVCLGYPFHPVGKPDQLRTDHLQELSTPTLIVQGERDAFGKPEEVAGYSLPNSIRIVWLPDGDHSFKPRKSSGLTQQDHCTTAIEAVAAFCESLPSR